MNVYQKQFQLQQEQAALAIQPIVKLGDSQIIQNQIDYHVDLALVGGDGEDILFADDIDHALDFKGGFISKVKNVADSSTK